MEPKEIRELIELVSQNDFSTFELEREGFRLKLVRRRPAPAPDGVPIASAAAVVQPVSQARAAAAPAAVSAEAPTEAGNGLVDMLSPIVGTFYASPSPEASPFVEVGKRVKKGQVMCIVEAMKVMNEIEAEVSAEVVEIAVQNGQPVEYGEVLFRLRP